MQNVRKDVESLYIFLTTTEVEIYVEMMQSGSSDNCLDCYNFEILNLFDPELQLINTKALIKSKFKKMLSEFRKV